MDAANSWKGFAMRMSEQDAPAEPARGAPSAERNAHVKSTPEQAPELPAGRILAFMLAWMAIWWAIVGGLLAPVLPGGWWTIAAVATFAAAPVVVLVRGFRGGMYPSATTRVWVMRPFWYVQLILPLVALAGALGFAIGLLFSAGPIAGRASMTLAAPALVLLAIAGYVGSRRLVVRRLDVLVDGLPEGLDGLRIAQVSDLHVGPHTPPRFLARVAAAVRAARPDLIAVTGDQVDDYAQDVAHFGRAFGDMEAPLGVFAIPGNHDVYAGWHEVRRGLEGRGIRVLVNEAVPLERRGTRFWIAGTGDPAGLHWPRGDAAGVAPDIERTLAGVPREEFILVLAHNPALWPALAKRGATLTLSGHTHHGQFSIPSLGWSLASPFVERAMGSHRLGDALLYIHPGTNYWGIPFRIGALPEVAVLTVRPGGHGSAIVPARAA